MHGAAAPRARSPASTHRRRRVSLHAAVLAVALSALAAVLVRGAGVDVHATHLPTIASITQYDVTGFIQTATVDNSADSLSRVPLLVYGPQIVIPAETILILPAN